MNKHTIEDVANAIHGMMSKHEFITLAKRGRDTPAYTMALQDARKALSKRIKNLLKECIRTSDRIEIIDDELHEIECDKDDDD